MKNNARGANAKSNSKECREKLNDVSKMNFLGEEKIAKSISENNEKEKTDDNFSFEKKIDEKNFSFENENNDKNFSFENENNDKNFSFEKKIDDKNFSLENENNDKNFSFENESNEKNFLVESENNDKNFSFESDSSENLIQIFRAGNKNALDILLTRFKPLVKTKAKTYYVVGGDPEDLIQEGMIGLYKAVLDFDAEKSDNFAAFAALCVVRQIQTAIKTAARQKHLPLNESLSLENEDSLPDSRNDPVKLLLSREALRDAENFIARKLTPLERDVITLHLDGKTHAEISARIGKNLKSVDNTLQRIRKKIKLSRTE
ncbi:MAG: sigma-70 family RNA polymerase sigma factor [Defluviitaleaceae bacterium]|nr:sigma-70 family RNA polymerase sigma factor [Defluviitaleaceae bacterium]